MYARLTFLRIKPGREAEAKEIYEKSVMPAARQQRGFVKAYLLRSEDEPHSFISISLWETKEHAIANELSGFYQEQVDKFAHIVAERPQRRGYEAEAQG